MINRKHGINTLLLGALLGAVFSQTAVAAVSQVNTVVTKTLNNTAKSSVATYAVTSNGTPYYKNCTQSNYTVTCAATASAGAQTWTGQSNAWAAVTQTFYVPTTPALAGTSSAAQYTPLGVADAFGVALDGTPYDPLTGVCAESSSSIVAHSSSTKCAYRVEGRLQATQNTSTTSYTNAGSYLTTGRLGFDPHNGHNQASGVYHYHGIPCGIASKEGGSALISCSPMSTSSPWNGLPASATLVGYARDGYPIVVQTGVYSSYSTVTSVASTTAGRPATSSTCANTTCTAGNFSMDMSTLVTSGTTFSMPSSKTFADFVYNGPTTGYGTGTGTNKLGLCNEAPNPSPTTIKTISGGTAAYVYYLTPNFPMVPRCLIGLTDAANISGALGFYHSGTD